MDTRNLVDPDMQPMIDMVPNLTFTPEILPIIRERSAAMAPPPAEGSPVVTSSRTIPGPDGAPDVRVVISRPRRTADTTVPAVMFIHGGGYILGTPEQFQPLVDEIVTGTDGVVVSVDYRLAPETRHPGPLLDCYAALAWMHENAGDLGIDLYRIAVVGESAGGGLAAALCLLARDPGEYRICFQGLIYPMIDDRTTTDAADQNPSSGQFIWTRTNNTFGWSALLPTGGAPDDIPLAAAARSIDLDQLPPAFIAVGSLDLFVDEDIDYARRLNRAGVPTELHVYPGAVHGYIGLINSTTATCTRNALITALNRSFT